VSETELDERHTHFVLVPGEDWGDESELVSAFATAVARGSRSVTVLANGGAIAWRDAAWSVDVFDSGDGYAGAFEWDAGAVQARNPDQATVAKMIDLAAKLGAYVQDAEGTRYETAEDFR
jgi:hypothetical protein